MEYLLNIFSRAIPPHYNAPQGVDIPALDDQVDVTIDKLIEASEILFNKVHFVVFLVFIAVCLFVIV